MASGFKKRSVSVERVVAVESVTAEVPIVGDPRLQASEAAPALGRAQHPATQLLGSSQDTSSKQVDYEVGKVYEVPIGLIKSNPFNPRAVYTASAVDAMAVSLSTSGQRISATAYVDDGNVFLIEGETRLRGARVAGLSTLRVEIRQRPTSNQQLYEEARAANVERRDQTPLDDALKWREILSKGLYPSQAALARALGLGEDHVSRTLSLANLSSRIIHAVAENPELLTLKMLNALREYWETQGDEATLELILEVAKSGLGYRDVAARRRSALNGPVRRPRSTRETLTFKGAKGELKSFEEDGRLELSLKGLTAETAREVASKLKGLFPKED